MPINITFKDFDTVCYSNQHNIIELIKHAVGLSIEINIVDGKADDAKQLAEGTQQNLNDLYDKLYNSGGAGGGGPGDIGTLQQIVDILREQTNTLNQKVTDAYNFHYDYRESVTGKIIQDLRDRVTALEARL